MSKVINIGNSIQGIYTTKVCESPMLADMRMQAYRKAGFTSEYDGSYEACVKLPDFERFLHDKELVSIVEDNSDKLNSEENRINLTELSVNGPHNNLILDQGINSLFTTYNFSTASVTCVVGTGTTPTFTDSAAVTATTSGLSTTVTASSSFFTAGMVGQLIRFNSGEERYISSQSGTTCVVTVAVNIVASTLFTVWAVNQVGLATETKRTSTYLTGTGNCGTTDVGAVRTYRRTYDFTAEVSNQNYTELGWSNTLSVGNNLFSRTLINGGTVSVLIGQQLRVIYDFVVTVGPSVSTAYTWVIGGTTGWPVSPATNTEGDYIRNNFGLSTVYTNGGSSGTDEFDPNISSVTLYLATGTTLPGFGSSYSYGTAAGPSSTSASSYASGNFYRDLTSTYNLGTANATDWRGVFSINGNWTFVFDQAQTKANTHQLSLTLRNSVSRTLTNP
jgi:hypothetical protein